MRRHAVVLLAGLIGAVAIAVPSSADGLGENVVWYVPDVAYAGHPVHIGVGSWREYDRGAWGEDYDLPVRVALDGKPLFASDSIFEHDGFHIFTITPPRAGVLSLSLGSTASVFYVQATNYGNPENGSSSDGMNMTTADYPIFLQVVEPNPLWHNATRWLANGSLELEVHPSVLRMNMTGVDHNHPVVTLFDVRGVDGRLQKSAWSGTFHVGWAQFETRHLSGSAVAYVTPRHDNDGYVGTSLREVSWTASETPVFSVWSPGFAGDCDGEVTIRLDGGTVTEGRRLVQAGTDVRAAILPLGFGSEVTLGAWYLLERSNPVSGEPMTWWSERAADPFSQLIFHPPGPGDYRLSATLLGTGDEPAGIACPVPFFVVPDPDPLPGNVTIEAAPSGGGNATITFTAERDGEALVDYAFEARVYRMETTDAAGAIVWMGKLHAKAGTASMTLSGLLPGEYDVRVYPSPESMESPRAVTDHPAGFHASFTVSWTPRGDDVPAVEPEPRQTGGLAGAFVPFALLAAAAMARGRKG